MFKVMVQGKTREELISQLVEFTAMLGIQADLVQPAPVQTDVPAEPKRGRGRPKKDEAPVENNPVTNPPQEVPSQLPPAAFDDPFAAPAEPPAEAKKEYTPEQVKAALMEFAKHRTGDASPADGAKRVYDLIQQYGYKNVKEIKAEHYAAIMAGTGLA